MSDLLKLAEELGNLISHDKILFLKTEPELEDFTRPFPGKLLIYGGKRVLTVYLQDKNDISNIFHQLRETVFSDGMTTIFWNLKNLMSFFRFHVPKNVDINSKVLDLKLIEGFLGIKQPPPESLTEALRRLNPYITNEDAKNIHSKIHKPLALQVIPAMETYTGVIDTSINKYVYPSYEIEGQTFGRLNCYKSFDNCITPMNMGDDRKELLKLHGEKQFFIIFDFRHMEVSMLQWLTKDPALKRAMEDYDDLYKGIYHIVFKQECDTEGKREVIKNLFLPIMFGMYPEEGSQIAAVRSAIKDNFKVSWDFMETHHKQAKVEPLAKDYFGRPRSFNEKPLSVRGFNVQSPSAVFCQEKLIELYNSLNNYGSLIYSIHDGYVLVANQENLNRVVVNGLKALQSESKMCKGLRLRVSCSLGVRLTQMKQIPTSKEKNDNG